MKSLTLGDQLGEIMARMDVATDAWAAAGHPHDGPIADAREAVYADLRAFNERCTQRGYL